MEFRMVELQSKVHGWKGNTEKTRLETKLISGYERLEWNLKNSVLHSLGSGENEK